MRIDRYELFGPFAAGGMAAVHFGKLFAAAGFQRVVAIKVPHAQVLGDPEFRSMFVDEARIVARIRSPHVVATLDIIEKGETLYQVMEYASGPSLSSLLKTTKAREEPVPIPIVLAIIVDALEGLHAAHEVRDDQDRPLDVVHRDVSPQNILVVEDGVAQVIDFGIATASGRMHLTAPGDVRGKISYMSPEQINGRAVDRRADVYAVGAVLYETLTGRRPFVGEDFAATALLHVLSPAPDPRERRPEVSEELAAIVARALEKNPQDRFPTARSMADALSALPTARASDREVAEWLADVSREFLMERRALIAALPSLEERGSEAIARERRERPADAARFVAFVHRTKAPAWIARGMARDRRNRRLDRDRRWRRVESPADTRSGRVRSGRDHEPGVCHRCAVELGGRGAVGRRIRFGNCIRRIVCAAWRRGRVVASGVAWSPPASRHLEDVDTVRPAAGEHGATALLLRRAPHANHELRRQLSGGIVSRMHTTFRHGLRSTGTLALLAIASSAVAGEPTSTEEHRALMISAQVMRKENKLLRARDLLTSCSIAACAAGPAECEEIRTYCSKKLAEVVSETPVVTLRVEDDRHRPLLADHVELDSAEGGAQQADCRRSRCAPGEGVVRGPQRDQRPGRRARKAAGHDGRYRRPS